MDFAARGPLFASLARRLDSRIPDPVDWEARGSQLTAHLLGKDKAPGTIAELDPALATRVYHLYLPIYFFVRDRVLVHRAGGGAGALAIGLSAPQGSGKTTLVDLLVHCFASDGLTCAAVSIDDFYLTCAEQDALAAANPQNPLLQVRGNAGTHDLALGTSVLAALKRRDGDRVKIPRYDKSARGGRGDRAPESAWLDAPPADVVLLEGWSAGFEPLPAGSETLAARPGLDVVNRLLTAYASWYSLMDAWVVLAADDVQSVYEWRLQAERAMIASGRPGMTDDQVLGPHACAHSRAHRQTQPRARARAHAHTRAHARDLGPGQVADFVARYMPAYEAFLPALHAAAEGDGVGGLPTLLVHVDRTRSPI